MQRDPQPQADALAVCRALENAVTRAGKNIFGLSADSPLLLVFLRHSGCSFCREALGDIAAARRAIERGGARIVLVHMGHPAEFEALLDRYGLSGLDRIHDPDRTLYQAFGLKRGTPGQLFGPRVLWRALPGGVLAKHGWSPARADAAQMPAMFLIHNSAIVRRFRHRTAADRPDYVSFCENQCTSARQA